MKARISAFATAVAIATGGAVLAEHPRWAPMAPQSMTPKSAKASRASHATRHYRSRTGTSGMSRGCAGKAIPQRSP